MTLKKKNDANASSAKLLLRKAKKPRRSRAIKVRQMFALKQTRVTKQHHENPKSLARAPVQALRRTVDQESKVDTDLPPIPREGFPQFSRLPPEVRTRIWEFSLPGPRIFEPRFVTEESEVWRRQAWRPQYHIIPEAPSIRAVCKESRAVTKKHGRFVYGNDPSGRVRGQWFNKDRDVLYFSNCIKERNLSSLFPGDTQFGDWNIGGIYDRLARTMAARYVAFRWETIVEHYDNITYFLQHSPAVECLWAMHDPDFHSEWQVQPTVYPVLDDDTSLDALQLPDGDDLEYCIPCDWGEMRQWIIWRLESYEGLDRKVEVKGMEAYRRERLSSSLMGSDHVGF